MDEEEDALRQIMLHLEPLVTPTPEIAVKPDAVFRHQMELVKATHGRYLDGHVVLPAGVDDLVLVMHPIPSRVSRQRLQPNLLHLTCLSDNTRKATWKSELTARHWRVVLRIRNGSEVTILSPATGEEIPGAPRLKCVVDGVLHLGPDGPLGSAGLLLTVITPLQGGNRGNPNSVRIRQVVEDMLSKLDCGGNAGDITKQFTCKRTNADAKVELDRCRCVLCADPKSVIYTN